jgi:hypothetical protein
MMTFSSPSETTGSARDDFVVAALDFEDADISEAAYAMYVAGVRTIGEMRRLGVEALDQRLRELGVAGPDAHKLISALRCAEAFSEPPYSCA